MPPVKIGFKVDELEDSIPLIARLHRLDAKHDKHFEDAIWSLYSGLAEEEDIKFALSYMAHGEDVEFELLDYPEWINEKLDELFARVREIQDGQFKPKPKFPNYLYGTCDRCPYNLTCPA